MTLEFGPKLMLSQAVGGAVLACLPLVSFGF